ncbi:hypothetical protein AADZ90_013785 [Aestuariibius sp. 2305UL40-4]|uniref:hypothetical protein n=1 Tax=Aestuariibius violaceus TaxID=3234132 RepID=UPI00345EFF2D
MTALPQFGNPDQTINMTADPALLAGFSVKETEFGYIICSRETPSFSVQLGQLLALVLAMAFGVASMALLFLPGSSVAEGIMTMKLVSSIAFGSVAGLCLHFATRGSIPELHVDIVKGEIREMLRTRAGRRTIADRYGFQAVSDLMLDRNTGVPGQAQLLMRYRDGAPMLLIATGDEVYLRQLRDRLSVDLLGEGGSVDGIQRDDVDAAA